MKTGIICKNVEDSPLLRKAAYKGASEFVTATINIQELPFPSDYKCSPCFLPKKYVEWADRIHNFKVRADDVWVVGFPKSGTTWLQNTVWQLLNNLDFTATVRPSTYQWIEHATLYEAKPDDPETFKSYVNDLDKRFDEFDSLASPRLFKTHLPSHLLPKDVWTVKPKVIYITRNPKDIVVSMYHMFINIVTAYQGSFDDFCDAFTNDHFMYTPFHSNSLSYWQLRHFENVLFLTYEDLMSDHFTGVKRISKFLGRNYSDKQLCQLTEHVSFDNMKKQNIPTSTPTIHGQEKREPSYVFCRKGKVGGFRDEMTDTWIERFDKWTAEHLHRTGLELIG